MNITLFEQTTNHLTREVHRWDRRLRLAESVVWVPRGVMLGVVIGVIVAILSRLRPWLLAEEIAVATAIVTVISGAGVALAIWLWPRSVPRLARHFDYRFALQERVSTALELTGGVIPYPERLAERQLSDAVGAARRVNFKAYLPLRARAWELVALAGLVALLAVLLLSDNPKADELLAERELQGAIDEQAEALQEAIEDIEANESLTEAEQEALSAPLQEALDVLQQPDISQQEAVAALAQANQELQEFSDGMMSDQESAYQNAANDLAGSEMTSDLAHALSQPDLNAAADALDDMAQDVGDSDMSEAEREELAERLEQAADRLEETNPAVARKLREAAQALREGDMEAAQQALREAAEMLRQQQDELENSPLSDAAENASEQVSESQQELAQAGQEGQQSQQSQQGQEGQSQTGESQAGQQGQSQAGQSQTGQEGQPGQAQTGQSQAGEQGQESTGDQGQSSAGEGEGQQASQPGEAGASAQQGQSQTGQEGDSQGGQNNAEGASDSQSGASGGGGAGEGEGGQGSDSTTGTQGGDGEEISTDNSPQDSDELQGYDPLNDPSTIGGQSQDVIDVGGESSDPEGEPVREDDFGPNPSGESVLSYSGVYGNYQGVVSDALESGHIPLDQRDVIHDYFSSLEPE
ncbi:MAG: hypothetical protein JXQ72_10745 [Anaerolineae bacterium]|nr:hypothetical protein [Anaerolineae bacterium]